MEKKTRKVERILWVLKKVSGILFVMIGIAGLVLPILPGWLLIFLGFELLGINLLFISQIKNKLSKKP